MILRRLRQLRRDDSAQMFLLSGIMVFLCAIFLIVTVNTSDTIYRRIQIQNAVDSATDTAVMWQARGLNLMQHLNNIHWLINSVAYPLEIIACCCCAAESIVYYTGQVLEAIPYTYAVGVVMVELADLVLETACIDICPVIDDAQFEIAKVIYDAQQIVACLWPATALIAANSMAQANGADPLVAGLTDYVETAVFGAFSGVTGELGVDISLIDPNNHVIENGDRTIFTAFCQNVMDAIPLYAMPFMELNWYERIFDQISHYSTSDLATFLGIHRVDDSEDYPWYLSEDTIEGCTSIPTHTGETPDLDSDDNEWGWQDSYWVGHPKYMTWVVASTNCPGGLLGWGAPPEDETRPDVVYDEATGGVISHSGVPAKPAWYMAPSGFLSMDRPPMMGLASGQVDGELVDHREDMDAVAEGHLIPVQIIGHKGTDFGIYH